MRGSDAEEAFNGGGDATVAAAEVDKVDDVRKPAAGPSRDGGGIIAVVVVAAGMAPECSAVGRERGEVPDGEPAWTEAGGGGCARWCWGDGGAIMSTPRGECCKRGGGWPPVGAVEAPRAVDAAAVGGGEVACPRTSPRAGRPMPVAVCGIR